MTVFKGYVTLIT